MPTPGEPLRFQERWPDLHRLSRSHPMYDAVVDEVAGRHIRVGDHWLTDFASCNYLGFDLDEEIAAAIDPAVRTWGTHPSWSRLLGSPRPYVEIEERLTDLLRAPDTLVLPTVTLIHTSVVPVLAGSGTVLVEAQAHRSLYDGAVMARAQGATLQRFRLDDPDQLADVLRTAAGPRLVCVDGVNSMTGNVPNLRLLARLCRASDALLYVDDAHGFGVIGEHGAAEPCSYGMFGNSVVRHLGESYDGVILVGGFSKAYSSLLAFLALPSRLKEHLKVAAAPYLYSGPSPVASLATVLAGFDVNARRGEEIRADLARKTALVLDAVHDLGLRTPNRSGLPIIELPLGGAASVDEVGRFLWDRGCYVTLAPYPLVPRDQAGIRIQVTAANTDDEIDTLTGTLAELADRYELGERG
jgi:8-amino-7-oxononanoate synthase